MFVTLHYDCDGGLPYLKRHATRGAADAELAAFASDWGAGEGKDSNAGVERIEPESFDPQNYEGTFPADHLGGWEAANYEAYCVLYQL